MERLVKVIYPTSTETSFDADLVYNVLNSFGYKKFLFNPIKKVLSIFDLNKPEKVMVVYSSRKEIRKLKLEKINEN